MLPHREAFYGGAAGGGKTDCLLMAALQFVTVPGYAALLLRRTYPDLKLPGAIMDRSMEWLTNTDAKWSAADKTWHFPSTARIAFGHLEHEKVKFRYGSAEFQYIGWDEAAEFTETQYRFMFSRLRRLQGSTIPLRMRAASNPVGPGHEWLAQRFSLVSDAPPMPKTRAFVPARLDDNPYLDRDEYRETLGELDPITRRRMLDGDWTLRDSGGMFTRDWFRIVDFGPSDPDKMVQRVRYWDLAATAAKQGTDPDWAVGTLMAECDGEYWIEDIRRDRVSPGGVETMMKRAGAEDGKNVEIIVEQEPGSSGKMVINHIRRRVLPGFSVRADRVTGSKELRARPFASAAEGGLVRIVRGPWVRPFLDELESFPLGKHDDQVDSASGAHAHLARGAGGSSSGMWIV